MEFSEVREYQMGDDIRFVDWNVSSRMGRLFVKRFVEERELTIILALDLSASQDFSSGRKSKKEMATEISAVIAFTALLNNDKVGLLIFTDRTEMFIPPKKGKTHLLRMIRDVIAFRPEGKKTSIDNALIYLNKAIKKRAIVFLISDFIDDGFARSLKISARKHDLIAIDIADPREIQAAKEGLFFFRDNESGEEFLADFGRESVREAFSRSRVGREKALADTFTRNRIDYLSVGTEDHYERALFNLFARRRRKFSR
jgi:uncharacterized protein (DUF58 family)